jgi:predicted 2-oxoglutarate/Fe(II)-dependent dioxygenase YbiX
MAEMRASDHEEARIYDKEFNHLVNEIKRRTRRVKVCDQIREMVKERLLELAPVFEQRFAVEVTDCQDPTFLIYRPGDFFEPHQDYSPKSSAPETIARRLISAVVFLNDEGTFEKEGEFTGGSLAFYGLLKDPRCQQIGIPVKARAGLLVAFRSDVFHQVTPVMKGERFSIVSWFI